MHVEGIVVGSDERCDASLRAVSCCSETPQVKWSVLLGNGDVNQDQEIYRGDEAVLIFPTVWGYAALQASSATSRLTDPLGYEPIAEQRTKEVSFRGL